MFLPIDEGGIMNVVSCNKAAFLKRLLAAVFMPGDIAPPMNAPFSLITS